MTSELYLGLDVGTQGTKALLLCAKSRQVVARSAVSYGLIEGLEPGAMEQHPSTWIAAIGQACKQLFRDCPPARVLGVGVSGQQHGLVVLDAAGEVIRPAKLWCDTSTAKEARELSARLGRQIPAGFTASKVLWLARAEPEHWRRAARVFLPHDYVNFYLTGRATTDAGDASGTGYFDAKRRSFDSKACAAIDARLWGLLPELVESGAPAGTVTARAAREFGLPEGILVASGSGDNMLSALGSGTTKVGRATISLGTSATIFSCSDRPLAREQDGVADFCDATGAWLPLVCVMNATGVLEEVARAFSLSHTQLTERAKAVPAGARGVCCLPYWNGERVPNWPQASGAFLGLRPGTLEAGVLYRAAMEGVAMNLALGLEHMRAAGIFVDAARVVGGGAKNDLWCQILADVLGLSLSRVVEQESAALGAALQALWCVRRLSQPSLSVHALAQDFVALECEFFPAASSRTSYAALLETFGARARALFGSAG